MKLDHIIAALSECYYVTLKQSDIKINLIRSFYFSKMLHVTTSNLFEIL